MVALEKQTEILLVHQISKNLHYFRSNREWNANFGVDMALRFSNALVDGRRPVKDHRVSFEETLPRF